MVLTEALRVLLVGNGGREHALAWKLAQSPLVEAIWVAPGNGGTFSGNAKVTNINKSAENFPELIAFARSEHINLVVPGPEAPLVAGLADACKEAGLRCFGPSGAAARMEGSKAFAKEFMKRHGIPTARYERFTDAAEAKRYLDGITWRYVIKADGLAAGKGVVIPTDRPEADRTLDEFLSGRAFGAAGREVVIEEFLEGQELSVLSFCDGYTLRSLPAAQDHKQIGDGDRGPMTGGMGCYAPTAVATPQLVEEIHRAILEPTLKGMRADRFPFVGMLFTGLMITAEGPRVLEYNVRGGDPETETLLPLLDSDLAELMLACADGYLDMVSLQVSSWHSATVIAVADGYPGSYAKGHQITLDKSPENVVLFHAGTKIDESNAVVTNGGRVMACTATGSSLREAIDVAYRGVASIRFEGVKYRKDIGHRGLKQAAEATSSKKPLTYADAGVSISGGNALVQRIKPLVKSTHRAGADASIGGFGGVVDLAQAGFSAPPLLVCAIDGVGTKLNIAHAMKKHDTVGIDCVAMNVNDLVVQGAEVLAFLDCYTCGKLDVDVAVAFIQGVAEGCKQAGCALVGGETAEMPGLFSGGDAARADGGVYDAVGASVGAIPPGLPVLPRTPEMQAGDILLGLPSSGVHSNGFSLVRKILARAGLTVHDPAPWEPATSVGASLLTPTRIYVKPLLQAVRKKLLLGMAHITGGGLVDNVPRMLPAHLAAELDAAAWPVPTVLRWLGREGSLTTREFSTTFNTGLGMVCVVREQDVTEAIQVLQSAGETVWRVGRLVERSSSSSSSSGSGTTEACVIRNCEQAWQLHS